MDAGKSSSLPTSDSFGSPRVRAAWKSPLIAGAGTPNATRVDDLPISKQTRVWFELVRTAAAISQVTINTLVALKVFGKI